MSRLARQFSESGIYHIMFRGINKQNIFKDANDYNKLKQTLYDLKRDMGFEIYTYCFMTNHVHIILKEQNMGDISLIMKRMLTKYAMWFNKKYNRTGPLIGSRYKSQPVEQDEYFLSVIRYVHQNPVKAKIVKSLQDYEWSSYNDYAEKNDSVVNIEFVLDMFNSYSDFIDFHKVIANDVYEVSDSLKPDDEWIRREIIKDYGIDPKSISKLDKPDRNEILHDLKNQYTISQLVRLTGISKGVIQKR